MIEAPVKTCADYEVAIEMRQRGALETSAASELTRHLETCPDCPLFEEHVRQTSRALRAEPLAFRPARKSIGELLSELRPSPLQGLLTLAAAVTGVFIAHGFNALFEWLLAPSSIPAAHEQLLPNWLRDLLTLIGFCGFAFFRAWRRARRERKLGATQEDLLGICRKELDSRIRRTSIASWTAVILGGFAIVNVLFIEWLERSLGGTSLGGLRLGVAAAIVLGVFFIPACYWRFRALPRLRKQREFFR